MNEIPLFKIEINLAPDGNLYGDILSVDLVQFKKALDEFNPELENTYVLISLLQEAQRNSKDFLRSLEVYAQGV